VELSVVTAFPLADVANGGVKPEGCLVCISAIIIQPDQRACLALVVPVENEPVELPCLLLPVQHPVRSGEIGHCLDSVDCRLLYRLAGVLLFFFRTGKARACQAQQK
jgi:hypothetical protein